MDGFETLAQSDLRDGSILNLERYRNAFSPYSNVCDVRPSTGDDVWVDTYYGLVYDEWIRGGGAVYGLTERMPNGPLDDMATDFLRVPFARIPVCNAPNETTLQEMLERVRQAYPALHFFYRGQPELYSLGRSQETLHALYGQEVLEPSLPTSAERRGVNIDSIGPIWSSFLRAQLDLMATAERNDAWFRRIHAFGAHYRFHRFALAMAQHYGLPSSGLDLTDDVETALFFALHRFAQDPQDPRQDVCWRLPRGSDQPVLFVFGLEAEQDYLQFESSFLGDLQALRPTRQSAHFYCRSWGMSRNRAAQSLLAGFRLDPGADYTTSCATNLFPGPSDDVIASFFDAAKERLGKALPELHRFLRDFAWVREGARPSTSSS